MRLVGSVYGDQVQGVNYELAGRRYIRGPRLRAGAVGHRGLPAVLGQRDDPVRGRLHALLNPVPRRGTIVDEEYRAFLLGGKAFAS